MRDLMTNPFVFFSLLAVLDLILKYLILKYVIGSEYGDHVKDIIVDLSNEHDQYIGEFEEFEEKIETLSARIEELANK